MDWNQLNNYQTTLVKIQQAVLEMPFEAVIVYDTTW